MSSIPDLAPGVHFDKSSQRWQYENTETGQEFFWTGTGWAELVDDAEIAKQQAAYSVQGVDENIPAPAILAHQAKKQAKAEKAAAAIDYTSNSRASTSAVEKPAAAEKKPRTKSNTAVHISNLSIDVTLEEIADAFGKFGIIVPSQDGVTPLVKMYNDDAGRFKGEALVVYASEASVELAVRLMDGQELRFGKGDIIQVKQADFSNKRPRESEKDTSAPPKGDNTPGDTEVKTKKKRAKVLESKKAVWTVEDDLDGFGPTADERSDLPEVLNTQSGKFSRVAVLKGMFTLNELAQDPGLLLEIKDDVREECEREFGTVTAVNLFDTEVSGVVTVKFAESLSAQACVAKNNGRFFSGRQILSYLYDGREKFGSGSKRRSREDELLDSEGKTEEEKARDEQKRLEDFGRWLMKEGDADADGDGDGES